MADGTEIMWQISLYAFHETEFTQSTLLPTSWSHALGADHWEARGEGDIDSPRGALYWDEHELKIQKFA